MYRSSDYIEKIISIFILLLSSFIALLISVQAQEYEYLVFGSNPFFKLTWGINNTVAFTAPLIQFAFISITSKLIFELFNKKINSQDIFISVSLAFIFHLSYTFFFLCVFYLSKDEIVSIHNISEMKVINLWLGLKFYQLERISLLSWLCVYLSILILYVKKLKMDWFTAVIAVVTPTILVIILKELCNKLL